MLSLAHRFEIKALLHCFQKSISEHFDRENVCEYLRLAHLYELESLLDVCHAWVFGAGVSPQVQVTNSFDGSQRQVTKLKKVDTRLVSASSDDDVYPDVRKSKAFKNLPPGALIGLLDAAASFAGCNGHGEVAPFRFLKTEASADAASEKACGA